MTTMPERPDRCLATQASATAMLDQIRAQVLQAIRQSVGQSPGREGEK